MKTHVIKKKPYISKKNKEARLKFALEHCNEPMEFWRNILWTDDSAFSLNGSYGKHFYRCTPEKKKQKMITEPTTHSDSCSGQKSGGHFFCHGLGHGLEN